VPKLPILTFTSHFLIYPSILSILLISIQLGKINNMSLLPQISFSDFIRTLDSTRKFYTKTQYFSHYKSFPSIFLLQKQRLNPRIYYIQELIMKLFVWSNGNSMNHHAKIQDILKWDYFWTIILGWGFLKFYTQKYDPKMSLVKPTAQTGSRGFIQNLFHNCWTFLQVSTNFGSLN
jgi:hypothetical protein